MGHSADVFDTVLRLGDKNSYVLHLQRYLHSPTTPIAIDGDFGPATERAVTAFQEEHGLYGDGVVGPLTWAALSQAPVNREPVRVRKLIRVDVGPTPPGGYGHLRLRDDAAADLQKAFNKMRLIGAEPTTSGGTRSLTARVNATRSAVSMHYLGLAVDLWVGGAMSNPNQDPYVVTRPESGGRYWRVWCRGSDRRLTPDASVPDLLAVRSGRAPVVVPGASFYDLTALLAVHGFRPIRSRLASWTGIATDRKLHSGTEWWHFQYERALKEGMLFGDCLRAIYTEKQLVGTPPWRFRNYVWREHAFVTC